MTLAACQKDEGLVPDTAATSSFTVTIPQSEVQSRAVTDAFGTGTSVNRCILEIYRGGTLYSRIEKGVTGKQVTFDNLRLVSSQTYDFVFWADCATGSEGSFEDKVYTTTSLDAITEKAQFVGNSDERDAFFAKETLEVTGPFTKSITLKRPFGLLVVKTNDLGEIKDETLKPTGYQVAFKGLPTTFNALTGEVSGSADVTYTATELAKADGTISMDFLWATENEAALSDFTMTFYHNDTEICTNDAFTNIPIRRNYRTNVSGNLLTKQGTLSVTIDPDFEQPDIAVTDVATADALVEALQDPNVATINVTADIDLSAKSVKDLTFATHKTIDIEEGATVRLGKTNRITAKEGLTLTGGGTIDNTSVDNSDLEVSGGHYPKSLIHVESGECLIDGVTLVNDLNYHWHGSTAVGQPYNSAAIAYWSGVDMTIRNAHVVSGEFTVCGMGREGNTSTVTLVDSYFESTSSNKDNGQHWAYAMRLFGSEILLENCEVKGIQGGVSIEGANAEIRSGKYYTVNTPGQKDAFYPLYITNSAEVTITGGEFIGANSLSNLAEGTSAVVVGDNDTGLPSGSVILKGGKFSGKAYNHETNTAYAPADGYAWQAIAGDESGLKWEVVAAQ